MWVFTLVNLQKNLKKWKKHSVLIIFPCHGLNQNSSTSDLSFFQVTSVEKRKLRKHFSASAYGLGLKKLFLSSLFSTLVTWEKLKSDVEKFYFRRDMEKNQNKILFQLILFPEAIITTWAFIWFLLLMYRKHMFSCITCTRSCNHILSNYTSFW